VGVQEVRVRVQNPSLRLSFHTPMAHRAAGMSTAPSPLFAPARSANGRADPVLAATGRATIRRKADFPPERAEGSSGSPTRSARLWRENSVSSSASLTDRDLRALVGGSSARRGRQVPPRWGHPLLRPHVLLWPHLEEAYRGRQAPPIKGAPADAEGMAGSRPGGARAQQCRDRRHTRHFSTVRKHLENILARIGVHSRSAAVAPMMPPAATGPVRSRPAPRPTSFDQPSGSEIRSAGR
jgi:hypothetical protein